MHFSILNFDRRFSHNNVVSTFRCILSLEQENCLDSFCSTKAILFQSQLLTNSHVCLLSKQCFACNDLKDGILIHLLMANVATINSRAACFKKYLSSAQDQSVDFAFYNKKDPCSVQNGRECFPLRGINLCLHDSCDKIKRFCHKQRGNICINILGSGKQGTTC